MNSQQRRHFSPEDKVAVLRRHLLDKVPLSDLCDEYHLQPHQFYHWQKIFFENGAAAFQGNGRKAHKAESVKDQKIQKLEAKLQRRDLVMAELMEAHVLLKKELGEP